MSSNDLVELTSAYAKFDFMSYKEVDEEDETNFEEVIEVRIRLITQLVGDDEEYEEEESFFYSRDEKISDDDIADIGLFFTESDFPLDVGILTYFKPVIQALIDDKGHYYDQDDIRLLWDMFPDSQYCTPEVQPITIEYQPLKTAVNQLVHQPNFCFR